MSNSCDPTDCSLPGSSVHGILQARILEWLAISFSKGSSHPGIESGSPALQADSLLTELRGKPWLCVYSINVIFFHFPMGCVYLCAQLCLILCDLMDCSPSGSSVHGIIQARILNRLPFPTQGDLPDAGIEPASLESLALAGRFFTTSSTWEAAQMVL